MHNVTYLKIIQAFSQINWYMFVVEDSVDSQKQSEFPLLLPSAIIPGRERGIHEHI